MSTMKAKSTAAAKRKRDLDSSGRFWTQWIEPRGAALLSQTLMPCHFVVKNLGSHNIRLYAQHGDDMNLQPGAVRATYVYGTLFVENRGDTSVLIEFEFFPFAKIR